MTPTLFADRFLAWPGGRALDLSSGQKVWVRPVAPVDGAPAAAWARRCATLSALWHPHLVEMVDFGPAGREGGFEAFTDGPPQACWRGRDAATARALLSAVAFLHARGWRAGRLTWSQVVHHGSGPALMPDEETGMPLEPDDEPDPSVARARILAAEAERLERLLASCHGSPPVPSRWRGAAAPAAFATNACESLVLDTTRRLAEVLDTGVPGRPRALQLALPPEPQQRVLLRAIARTARARGYVPLAASLLEDGSRCIPREDLFEVVAQRHVLLLHRVGIATGEAGLALSLLRLGLESSRPHVVLLLFEPAARTTWSGRLSPTALQAREPRVSYAAQPVQAESRLRGRVLEACACITRGRHAAAERVLREHLGMTGRRGDRSGAGDAALALGRLLLLRGRAPEACHQFEAARQHFDAVRQVTWAARAAAFAALARTDAGRFEEAEAAAHAACLAASETGDGETRLFASTALARCLYWQGRYEEGQAAARDEGTLALSARPDPAVSRVAEPVMPFGTGRPADAWSGFPGWVDPHVGRACLLARLALAGGDLASAGRAAAEARERARVSSAPAAVAAACTALALVYGAIGDIALVRQEVAAGLLAARHARAPLRALRLRIGLVSALLQSGRATEARPLAARLARLDSNRLPAVVRLAAERAVRTCDIGPVPAARCRPEGVPVIRPGPSSQSAAGSDAVSDVVEMLSLCQESEDDDGAVQAVVARLRRRYGLVTAVCLARDGDVLWPLALDGYEPVPEPVARRAMATGHPLPPSSSPSGLEAAVPVRFAGRVVAALACRWPADVRPDWARVAGVLSAAAAAVAPCVRASVDRRAAQAQADEAAREEILGVSEAVRALRHEIGRAAAAPFSVILEGESGSGKELVARAIHRLGPRARRRLCALNCAALSDELFEAELFGHARGAFTGAVAERKGLFEEADGGTLVLDEIGELTARAQAKLLRAIQEGEIRRIGENFSRPVDVRLVSATNRPLRAAAESGLFRRDLLYRLEVIRIVVPPLRDRTDDIPVLADHFWRASTSRLGSRAALAPATLAALARYDWPGNVRELQNVMAALAVQAPKRGTVGAALLPAIIAGRAVERAATLEDARAVFENRYVRAALARAGGHRGQAARDLGLSRQGLAKLLARLRIEQGPDAWGREVTCGAPADAAG
ncbi:MAG: hypothetical protein EHM24_12300 [Acidobacteria bacterium]|nr:MAG: hypothetical protein EHM24_12300 [Acidobacteriota bacterium]